jgi:hypothetical protein
MTMLAWVVSTPVDLHDIKSCGFCICAMVGHEIYKTYLAWVIIQEAKDPEQVLARGSGGRHIDVRPERPAQEVMRDYRITAPRHNSHELTRHRIHHDCCFFIGAFSVSAVLVSAVNTVVDMTVCAYTFSTAGSP